MTNHILRCSSYRLILERSSRYCIIIIKVNDSVGRQKACYETDAADIRTVYFSHNTSDGQTESSNSLILRGILNRINSHAKRKDWETV